MTLASSIRRNRESLALSGQLTALSQFTLKTCKNVFMFFWEFPRSKTDGHTEIIDGESSWPLGSVLNMAQRFSGGLSWETREKMFKINVLSMMSPP